jgi:hypothetical protein
LRKPFAILIPLIALVIVTVPVLAENSMVLDSQKFMDDKNNSGLLFEDKEIELNDFRVLPIIEDIGIVSDPQYYFQKNIDFPLGYRYFILKIEDRDGNRRYFEVEYEDSGNRFGNDYWIFTSDAYMFGSDIEINFIFNKKQYSKDPNVNYLELNIIANSERRIYNQLEFEIYFLANEYNKGKGFIYAMSNYDEDKDIYHNVIIKRWSGEIKKAYNVRTYQGDDKYESIQYIMETNGIRQGLTYRLGKLDLFYKATESPEEAVKYFEDLLY